MEVVKGNKQMVCLTRKTQIFISQSGEKVDKLQNLGHVSLIITGIQMSEGTELMYDSKCLFFLSHSF